MCGLKCGKLDPPQGDAAIDGGNGDGGIASGDAGFCVDDSRIDSVAAKCPLSEPIKLDPLDIRLMQLTAVVLAESYEGQEQDIGWIYFNRVHMVREKPLKLTEKMTGKTLERGL